MIDSILEVLSDGQWLDFNELSTKEGLRKGSMTQLLMTLNFLAEYGFIELSEVWKGDPKRPVLAARISSNVQTFVRKVKWMERVERERRIFNP